MQRHKQWLIDGLCGWKNRPLKRYLHNSRIELVDVGARGGLEPRWESIRDYVEAFTFEPDESSCQELEKLEYIKQSFPVGLGLSEGTCSFNVCRAPSVSSLLEPDTVFLSRFPNQNRFDVISRRKMTLTTLDRCLCDHQESFDFIKIDTQGTELDILRGGGELLKSNIVGLEIEVEFLSIYRDQSLFGDVCAYLKPMGYEFVDFANIYRWERKQFTDFGQTMFADALFVRSPETFATILKEVSRDVAREKAKKYVAIVALYDHIDLLPICESEFRSFLDGEDAKAIGVLHRALSRQRRKSLALLHIMNRFVFRWLGIRAFPLQIS